MLALEDWPSFQNLICSYLSQLKLRVFCQPIQKLSRKGFEDIITFFKYENLASTQNTRRPSRPVVLINIDRLNIILRI